VGDRRDQSRRALELRAATTNDRDFLWEVHRTALRPAVEATWGWDEAFQVRYFAEHFATSDRFIVCVDGVDAGVLQFTVKGDHLFLATVALLPEHQGRGIGTDLVNMVLAEGRRHNLPVRLQVLKVNRARKLYERLGFEAYGESETHVHMERAGRYADSNRNTVTRLLRLLDAMPRWLRWALFLPVGIGCSLMVQGVVQIGFDVAGPIYRTAPGVIERVVMAFAAGATLTVFPAMLSPRPWLVGLVMFTVGLLLRVSLVAYLIITAPYLRSRVSVVAVVIAATAVGGCLGLFLIGHLQREKGPTSSEQAARPL
jgi:ribosomal protein S18 acetylase RimI-like enzyme